MDEVDEHWGMPSKRRRISFAGEGIATTHAYSHSIMGTAKVQDVTSTPVQEFDADSKPEKTSKKSLLASNSLAGQSVAPFLARHIPDQYAPMGGIDKLKDYQASKNPNTKYCYRHRPDLKCRRQANEPSMDQLQQVSCGDHEHWGY